MSVDIKSVGELLTVMLYGEIDHHAAKDIREKIDEETIESIERVKENTQRQMERLTNEKMMAINEYSDTVMKEIHKNHEEAVFLYDMLNNKHAQVKNTAAEISQVMKQSKQVQSAAKSVKSEKKNDEEGSVKDNKKEEEDITFAALDDRFLEMPGFAVEKSQELVYEMATKTKAAILEATYMINHFDMNKTSTDDLRWCNILNRSF